MDITTDSGVDSDERFNPDIEEESDFNDQVNSDMNSKDENIQDILGLPFYTAFTSYFIMEIHASYAALWRE